ncbi:MAG: hypothetical protein NVSMB59_06370 [Vulcanimicrobiaceae bacterium]
MLESEQLFALILIVTIGTCAVIVSDEARRRALDARVCSALWFLEPRGNVSVLRFLFGSRVADQDIRHALKRLERAQHVAVDRSTTEASYAVTPEGLYALERGGLGMRDSVDGSLVT